MIFKERKVDQFEILANSITLAVQNHSIVLPNLEKQSIFVLRTT